MSMKTRRLLPLALIGVAWMGCTYRQSLPEESTPEEPARLSEAAIARIDRFCGDCHPMPLASSFPKDNWAGEVRQGFNFYFESGRTDLDEPNVQETIAYFQAAAPEQVIVPRADELPRTASPVRFEPIHGLGSSDVSAATAQVLWEPSSKSVLFTDMQNGTLKRWTPGANWPDDPSDASQELLATGENICRTFPYDWDQDGTLDYITGELGTFTVGDHKKGGVSLVFGGSDSAPAADRIADGFGRTIEAKPLDYDSDGRMDLLVADFGWRDSGALRLLRNVGGTLRQPKFELEMLDSRHGVLGVEVADMDGDSKLDFVVAFGQEFETLEVFYNRGPGEFDHETIVQLPDPSYNLSAFQVVDLDQDGRLDVVYTCGDTMDTFLAKPFHGLRWTRNLGDGNWEDRDLGLMVGALQPTVADLDNDGDYDIAVVGLFPKGADHPGAYDSVCWWEQKENLHFVRHSIERDNCTHATCAAADVNQDGRIDLIVGDWFADDQSAFSVFLNLPVD